MNEITTLKDHCPNYASGERLSDEVAKHGPKHRIKTTIEQIRLHILEARPVMAATETKAATRCYDRERAPLT